MKLTELSDAVEASHRALAAIINGDVEPFLALYSDAEDITIGNPFGPLRATTATARSSASTRWPRMRQTRWHASSKWSDSP